MIRNVASGIDGDIPAARSQKRRRGKVTVIVIEVIAGFLENECAGEGAVCLILAKVKDIPGTRKMNGDLSAARIGIRERRAVRPIATDVDIAPIGHKVDAARADTSHTFKLEDGSVVAVAKIHVAGEIAVSDDAADLQLIVLHIQCAVAGNGAARNLRNVSPVSVSASSSLMVDPLAFK